MLRCDASRSIWTRFSAIAHRPILRRNSDSRYEAYAAEFGRACWELDALDPIVIADIVRTEIQGLIDHETWAAAKAREDANRAKLEDATTNWALVQNITGGDDPNEIGGGE